MINVIIDHKKGAGMRGVQIAVVMAVAMLTAPVWAQESGVVDETARAATRELANAQAAQSDQDRALTEKAEEMLKDIYIPENFTVSMDNTICPVTGRSFGPDFPSVTVEWYSGVYNVCADGCAEKFLADPAKYNDIVIKEVGDFI